MTIDLTKSRWEQRSAEYGRALGTWSTQKTAAFLRKDPRKHVVNLGIDNNCPFLKNFLTPCDPIFFFQPYLHVPFVKKQSFGSSGRTPSTIFSNFYHVLLRQNGIELKLTKHHVRPLLVEHHVICHKNFDCLYHRCLHFQSFLPISPPQRKISLATSHAVGFCHFIAKNSARYQQVHRLHQHNVESTGEAPDRASNEWLMSTGYSWLSPIDFTGPLEQYLTIPVPSYLVFWIAKWCRASRLQEGKLATLAAESDPAGLEGAERTDSLALYVDLRMYTFLNDYMFIYTGINWCLNSGRTKRMKPCQKNGFFGVTL